MTSAAGSVWKTTFEICPIIMTGGMASNIPGGMLPAIAITQAISFVSGLASGAAVPGLDGFFAHFMPVPGATLIENQFGMYPFANLAVAANALIAQPLHLSMRMICPVNTTAGYYTKLATMTAMKNAFDAHNNSGGLYTIMTLSYIYSDCVMIGMRDIGSQQTKQVQVEWQIDFMKPLVRASSNQQALNNQMAPIANGVQNSGAPSGPPSTVGSAAYADAAGAYYGPPGVGSDTVASINQVAAVNNAVGGAGGPPFGFPGQP
jgi:hypothetical protein